MTRIIKAPETMTGRERIRRTFEFEKTDRVPIGYDTNPTIYEKLKKELGVEKHEDLLDALGVDYRPIGAPYKGPQLFAPIENRQVNPLDGCIMRKVENESGYYWDYCDFPLKDKDDDESFDNFPMPNPDDFDYNVSLEQAKSYHGKYALYVGNPGFGDIINTCGMVMGMEDILCHLMMGTPAVIRFISRHADYKLGILERILDKCKNEIDFMWLGEDLGTQKTPMISMDLYQEFLEPVHQRFVDLAKAYNIPSMIHTCGSSSWVYEEFIKMGIRGVDTLQPEAVNMSPQYLADHFGGRLAFRGCISTAGPLAYGSVEDITKNCLETLEIMKKCRGYQFAPTHAIQDNTPVENIIAMYQTAHDYGRY